MKLRNTTVKFSDEYSDDYYLYLTPKGQAHGRYVSFYINGQKYCEGSWNLGRD